MLPRPRSLRFWLSVPLSLSFAVPLLVACGHTAEPPTAATLGDASAVDPATTWLARAAPRRFGPGADAPDGCFAWSVGRGQAACALGQWPHRRASQPRVVSFLAASGVEPAPLPLQLEGEEPSLAAEPKIAVMSRNRLDVAMRDGTFVDLPPGVAVPRNAPARTFGPFTVSVRHDPARRAEGDTAPSTVTRITVRLERAPRTEAPLVDESFGPVACADPVVKVYVLSSTNVLVERSCRLAGEGKNDLEVAAWVCDATQRVCR